MFRPWNSFPEVDGRDGMVDKRRAGAGVRKTEGVEEWSLNVYLNVQALTVFDFRCSERGGRGCHDMRAGKAEPACKDHGAQAEAGTGGLSGPSSPERDYGVIGEKDSEAHFTE